MVVKKKEDKVVEPKTPKVPEVPKLEPVKKAAPKKAKTLISVDVGTTAAVTIHNKIAIFLHDGRREVLNVASGKINVTISDA